MPTSNGDFKDAETTHSSNGSLMEKNHGNLCPESMKPPEWIEWRESTGSKNLHGTKDDIISADQGGSSETENQEPESSPVLRKLVTISSPDSDSVNPLATQS